MSKKVLIVEDEKLVAKAYSDHLERKGYEVDIATDGESGLAKIKENKPDLILLDILMPKKGGILVLKEIRLNKELSNIPVIVLTNLGGFKNISEALSAGAIYYFIKSDTSLDEINSQIDKILTEEKV
ncbi:response regulator transcription factor [Patescibacteria group bacterium]